MISGASIRDEWRNLGFFYDRDDERKEWTILSTQSGILKFAELLEAYALNSKNERVSEHEHYGPYSYLEVMTWNGPGMDNHSIHGSLADIKRLSTLIRDKISEAKAGDIFIVRKEYSETSEYSLVLKVMPDNYDPSTSDKALANKAL